MDLQKIKFQNAASTLVVWSLLICSFHSKAFATPQDSLVNVYQDILKTQLTLSEVVSEKPPAREIPGSEELNSVSWRHFQNGIGLPGLETEPPPLPQSYATLQQIFQDTFADIRTETEGEKIRTFLRKISFLLSEDPANPPPVAVSDSIKVLLNRARDVFNTTAPSAGYNVEALADVYAHYFLRTFELASVMARNQTQIICVGPLKVCSPGDTQSLSGHSIYLANFGLQTAERLWSLQSETRISDGAQAIILIKLLGYLGMDFNMDLRRREPELSEVVHRILDLQNYDTNYQGIVAALREGKEPQRALVAGLRGKVQAFFMPDNYYHLATRLRQLDARLGVK